MVDRLARGHLVTYYIRRDKNEASGGRWLSAWGDEFPSRALAPAHVDANFFRTDLGSTYHWDGSSWVLGEAGDSGGAGLITIREGDGVPSLVADTLTIDEADGLVLTDLGGGEARLDLAAVPESVLDLDFPTHDNANDPTADEKDALAGTDGTPSAANPYVTDSDPRLTGGAASTAYRRFAFMFGGD
jgi:hypothetical protein